MALYICDHCNNRQENRDPNGCFREVSGTDTLSKVIRSIFGCERFRDTNTRRKYRIHISDRSAELIRQEAIGIHWITEDPGLWKEPLEDRHPIDIGIADLGEFETRYNNREELIRDDTRS